MIQFIDSILRGVAQVVFMNNSITGLLIIIGIFVSSRYSALCMLLGISASSLTAIIFKLNMNAFANGIYGFNGTLVGIGISLFSFGDDSNFTLMP